MESLWTLLRILRAGWTGVAVIPGLVWIWDFYAAATFPGKPYSLGAILGWPPWVWFGLTCLTIVATVTVGAIRLVQAAESKLNNRVFHAREELRRISGNLRLIGGIVLGAGDASSGESIEKQIARNAYDDLGSVLGAFTRSQISIMVTGVWPPRGELTVRLLGYGRVASEIERLAENLTEDEINPSFTKKHTYSVTPASQPNPHK